MDSVLLSLGFVLIAKPMWRLLAGGETPSAVLLAAGVLAKMLKDAAGLAWCGVLLVAHAHTLA
ncbi:hypothetical protein HNQ96_000543 [Aminobacter lissarensis]|uniref:Uncharacterized protein n=1 Tax=Aminobacter carboxidus TaxID=376165 RepID=A0A8E1WBW0_9HYPH|nr:hypothetical protein [Aminobacter lissarensis]MBB6464696.1 hypothetical protein [Aminobacter lissarensis]